MGWKTFKEKFGIDNHIVFIEEGKLLVGSQFIRDLITVDLETGLVSGDGRDCMLLHQKYPALRDASPEEVLAALNADDIFSASIKVYSYEPGKIREHFCEVPGWPNVTHDGEMMYQYRHSTEKELVISWAKQDVQRRSQNSRDAIEQLQQKIITIQSRLDADQAWELELQQLYPDIAAAD